jgi:leader peptidase (prepilin peptidase)/N-methyltransferase
MGGRLVSELAVACLLAGLFGLLFGSFLNVCIYRIPRDLSVVMPRSFCPACAHPIAWYDNLPVVSYLFLLRGRCRACGKAIGARYPIVELTTSILFLLTVWTYGSTLAALKWAIFEAIVVVLFWTDLEERILPDELTLGGSVAGLILAVFVPVRGNFADILLHGASPVVQSILNALVGAVVLAGATFLIGAAYSRIRGREGLGFGDVKLLVLFGIYLGLENGLLALMIGSIAGSLIGVGYILMARKNASTYELPFGSFLCFGAVLVALSPIGFGGLTP